LIKVQVKKPENREAILQAAFSLFSANGYAATTVPQIASAAGVSTANVYVYFESKLAILFAIHGPWIETQFLELGSELQRLRSSRSRLHRLLTVLFRELPAREGGFANNVMQAIATARPDDRYRPSLVTSLEDLLLDMLATALPGIPRRTLEKAGISHFLMMALDGYIVFHHVAPERGCSPRTIDFLCDLFESKVATAADESTD
jgi:AcrR family transcriptional regulator